MGYLGADAVGGSENGSETVRFSIDMPFPIDFPSTFRRFSTILSVM